MSFINAEESPIEGVSKARCILDFKVDDKWVKSTYMQEGDKSVQKQTRAYVSWTSMKYRCKPNGLMKAKHPTYIECTYEFEDFQSFADWCQNEQGYLNKQRTGRYWSLDKDLLTPFNKIYSPEKCCFIPAEINCLLISSNACRGEFPIGVAWHTKDNCLYAQCQDGNGKIKHLGKVSTPQEGHRKWQEFKISVMKNKAEKYSEYYKICAGLDEHIQLLQFDYDNNLETVR